MPNESEEGLCDHSDLPPSQCAHCRGDKPDWEPERPAYRLDRMA